MLHNITTKKHELIKNLAKNEKISVMFVLYCDSKNLKS